MKNYLLDKSKFEEINYFDTKESINYKDVILFSDNLDRVLKYPKLQKGICLLSDRSPYYVAAIMGIWNSGHYVIPLNNKWPVSKLKIILEQIKPELIIVDEIYDDFSATNQINIKALFKQLNNKNLNLEKKNLLPSEIAYIIFTSGSTGEPKGVVISVNSFRQYIIWTLNYFEKYKNSTKLLLTSEFTFDITFGDIAFALCYGVDIGILVNNKNIPSLANMIMKFNIDVLYSVPTTHSALLNFAKKKRGINLSSLSLIMSGGDKFSWQLVRDYTELTSANFYNVYGPTEVTINCFAIRLDDKLELEKNNLGVPIGECFNTLESILLDENGEITNTEGELCICGNQIMMGYHKDQKRTKDAMVSDPRYKFIQKLFYKTGDIGFIHNNYMYLKGRKDGLIKVKGYRIHPDEVSKVLDSFEEIDTSIVISYGRFENVNLAAFIKLKDCYESDEAKMFDKLKVKIPEYLIPAKIIFIDKFILNQSGKIDRKKLLAYV